VATQTTEDTFFEGKRPWSVVKDQVIGAYIKPFTRKVAVLGHPILIIDAFAGPGVFEDGKPGSPLIICNAASGVKALWQAVFINQNKEHHERLQSILRKGGWLTHASPLLGESRTTLQTKLESLTNETVFLYLDPFGLKGFDFGIVSKYLERAKSEHRTEVVINMSMPTLHRLATVQAIMDGKRDDPQIDALNRTLSNALGGRWWQEIMWTKEEPHIKEKAVMEYFMRQLSDYLPYTGYCPVRESADAAVKYYITFASAHPDAQAIMSDEMLKAYEKYIFGVKTGGQQSFLDWKAGRDLAGLEQTIIQTVQNNPNQSRQAIWLLIVRDNFMKWLREDYHDALKRLADQNKLVYRVDPKTGRRNQHSILSLATN